MEQVDNLYKAIVGGMKFAPSEFWSMTLKEAKLVVKGDRERQENDLMVNYFAHCNAIGACLSKDHTFINPFNKGKKKPKPKTSEKLKNELKDMINNWR